MIPILYSFRRCPYAIRARLAILAAQETVIMREVILRDKPLQLLEVSKSATVPCLVTCDTIVDQSLDIMKWALALNDPYKLLDMPSAGWEWIKENDGPFKFALDRTKYASRYPLQETEQQRTIACSFLTRLDQQLDQWVFDRPTVVDYAILPFVRQFAFIDKNWFDQQPWPNLHNWLTRFLVSEIFEKSMPKYAQWREGDPELLFPKINPPIS